MPGQLDSAVRRAKLAPWRTATSARTRGRNPTCPRRGSARGAPGSPGRSACRHDLGVVAGVQLPGGRIARVEVGQIWVSARNVGARWAARRPRPPTCAVQLAVLTATPIRSTATFAPTSTPARSVITAQRRGRASRSPTRRTGCGSPRLRRGARALQRDPVQLGGRWRRRRLLEHLPDRHRVGVLDQLLAHLGQAGQPPGGQSAVSTVASVAVTVAPSASHATVGSPVIRGTFVSDASAPSGRRAAG